MKSSPDGLYPASLVAEAVGIKPSTITTWADRGVFNTFDHPEAGRGKTRNFSRLDVLSLSLLAQCNSIGLSIQELGDLQMRRWAGLWSQTRYSRKRVTHLHVRYYGTPGAHDARTSIAMNDEALENPPDHGKPRLTITFDLDATFEPVLQALKIED